MANLGNLLVSGASRLLSTLRVSGDTHIDGTLYLNGQIGSNTQAVYVNSDGVITPATGTLTNSISGNAASTTKWQTARTLTIGNKGQSVDGTANVTWALQDVLIRAGNEFNYTADGMAGLWFNYRTQTGTSATTKITSYSFGNGQGGTAGVTVNAATFKGALDGNASTATKLSTTGGTSKFWRGDNTWSDTISGGTLKITNNSNTVTIGSQNSSYMHFSNSANIPFWFNKTLQVDGNIVLYNQNTSLEPGYLHLGGATSATMTIASTNPRIKFSEGSDGQPVYLIYSDYDSYRPPAGLKVVGGTSATPAWFETEGSFYATGTGASQSYYLHSSNIEYGRFWVNTKGVASTTTTYTNPDNSSQTKTGYINGVTGTTYLSIGNNKVAGSNGSSYSSPGSATTADNAQGYLRLYSSGSGYADMTAYSNDKTRIYPVEGINLPENKIVLNFRPGSSSYYTHFSYQTNGNEALVMATQNAVTSFIFINGESYANVSSSRWTSLVPALQIKNNCVSIGELIPSGTTPTYKLKVAGNTWIHGPLHIGRDDTAASTGYATANVGANNYIAFYGVYGDNPGSFNHTYIGESIYGSKTTANEQSELLLFHGNDMAASSGPDRIRLFAGQVDVQVFTSATYGTWNAIRATAGAQIANFSSTGLTVGTANTCSIGLAQTNGTGLGISLYGGTGNVTTYGLLFATTGNRGKWGDVQSDWATYFTMNAANQRGWIWQGGGTAEANMSAALSSRGVFTARAVGNNQGYIAFPQNGSYFTSTSTITGALKIILPRYQTNCMLSFDVNIFTYDETNSNVVTYRIGGYEYGSTGWHAPEAKVSSWGRGDKINLDVRFGYDGSKTCVTIGETNTTWRYPQVSISNITYGYSDVAMSSWGYGWSVSFTTTLPSSVSTKISSPAMRTPGTETYMAYYATQDTISATSNARIVDGALQLRPNNGSYREGLRIYPTGSWATIVLGGNDLSANSGTSANSWSIHNNNGNFFIARNGSSSSSTGYLAATTESSAGYWALYHRAGINGKNTSYNFYVNGSSYLVGETVHGANVRSDTTRTDYLGTSSYYWKGAYIWGDGAVHPASVYGVNSVGGATYVHSDTAKGPMWWLWRDLGDRGSRIWNMAGQNITIEYTTNSGSSWAVKSSLDTESKRSLTTSGNSGYGNIGNTLTANAGGSSGNYTQHPQRVAGRGVRITLDSRTTNGSAHYGWWSILRISLAGYMGTYTIKTESAYYNSSGTETWNVIDGTRTFCNNTSWDSTLYIHPETTYYWDGANNRTTGNNKRYMHKLRLTLICTAVQSPNTASSYNRYSGWISSIACYGGTSGSDVTTNTTYPMSSRYQWTMGRYDEPYYIYDYRLGRVQFSTDTVRIYDDLLYTAANTDKWATLQLGNGDKKDALNRHAEGQILMYSSMNGYHYIRETPGNTGGYTAYLAKATGWIAIGGNGSSTGVGSASQPVYMNASGQLVAGNTIPSTSNFVQKSGDTMTGALTVKGWRGTVNVDYGETLPSSPSVGQIFFQYGATPLHELPVGGSAGYVLKKRTATDYDVQWSAIFVNNQTTKFYVAGPTTTSASSAAIFNTQVYVQNNVLYGAAWNDYAEYRERKGKYVSPGRCVVENGDGSLLQSTKRLQPGAEIVSDTYGFAIGKTNKCKLPIAVSGRVLAYPYEDINTYKVGAPVCSGPNGTISQMTDEEARLYPWLIIGTVSSIPTEKTWGANNVKINGRIWIRVK